ncbi:MAG: hypothetical protein WCT20_01445 [Candidatus Babeliales bacterium]
MNRSRLLIGICVFVLFGGVAQGAFFNEGSSSPINIQWGGKAGHVTKSGDDEVFACSVDKNDLSNAELIDIDSESDCSTSPMSFTPSIHSGLAFLGNIEEGRTDKSPLIQNGKKYCKFITERFLIQLARGRCDKKQNLIASFFTEIRKFRSLQANFIEEDCNEICNDFKMIAELFSNSLSSRDKDDFYNSFFKYFKSKLDDQYLDLKCATDKRLYFCVVLNKEIGSLRMALKDKDFYWVDLLQNKLVAWIDTQPEDVF